MTRAFLLLAVLLFSNVVQAQQSDDERARMHFQSGLSYYEQARYSEAAREFSEAYELSQRPALLLNLSQAYERDLKFAEAIAELERYLQVLPESPQRRTVETRIARLRELQARVAPTQVPTPTPDVTPEPEPTTTPEPEPEPVTSATPPADSARNGSGISVPGVIVAGTGGLLLAASLVTGLMAHSRHGDLETRCPGGSCPADAQSDIDSGKTLAWLSTGFLAGGVIAAAVGTVLILTHGGSDDSQDSAPVAANVVVAPGHLMGMAHVSF